MQRSAVLEQVAQRIEAVSIERPIRVGVDGLDTAGKTTFGDELATLLRRTGRQVIRASVDGFHNPRPIHYQRGKLSPEGYYLDTFNVEAFRQLLLEPFGQGGTRLYVTTNYDLAREEAITPILERADETSILIVDGVFLHRPELRDYWDVSVYLRISPDTALQRAIKRDVVVFGSIEVVRERYTQRYLPAQQTYVERCQPEQLATIVIEHNDPAEPHIISVRTPTD